MLQKRLTWALFNRRVLLNRVDFVLFFFLINFPIYPPPPREPPSRVRPSPCAPLARPPSLNSSVEMEQVGRRRFFLNKRNNTYIHVHKKSRETNKYIRIPLRNYHASSPTLLGAGVSPQIVYYFPTV